MPEYCTCGTQLVEGARFCHKCGRPTSGEPEPPVEVPRIILTAPVLPVVGDAGVSFANPVVLRIAFAASALSILLDFTPIVNVLFILWSMGAGFMAVWMYRKRTGQPISVSSGAKMGWITGVFTFVILTVMLTTMAVLSGGKLVRRISPANDPAVDDDVGPRSPVSAGFTHPGEPRDFRHGHFLHDVRLLYPALAGFRCRRRVGRAVLE